MIPSLKSREISKILSIYIFQFLSPPLTEYSCFVTLASKIIFGDFTLLIFFHSMLAYKKIFLALSFLRVMENDRGTLPETCKILGVNKKWH